MHGGCGYWSQDSVIGVLSAVSTRPAVSVVPEVSTVTVWNTASSMNTKQSSSSGSTKVSGTTEAIPGEIGTNVGLNGVPMAQPVNAQSMPTIRPAAMYNSIPSAFPIRGRRRAIAASLP